MAGLSELVSTPWKVCKKRGREADEVFVDTDEGKTRAGFEPIEEVDVLPPALSRPHQGTFEAVVMEYREKKGGEDNY
ncbi:hypothetical protein AVEN_111007-1 [Araneus ventricosus]|uniref:Uncharacterized protein n=1 Tax=Araneus ventricosus TaxID=182803 RepID=A0A4Y2HNR9_ARAVE|nr:hypothetical protein AVEN_111007-1 [Araneus ventricosus]